jgi:hypothetical protein
MNNSLIANVGTSFLTSLIGGAISGILVIEFIENKKKKSWRTVQGKLVELLDNTLNGILTGIRISIGVGPPPSDTYPDEKKIRKNYTNFLVNLLKDLERDKDKIEFMDLETERQLSYNLTQINNSLEKLAISFGSFNTVADPWFVESIFKIQDTISSVILPYMVYPELGDPKNKNDEKLIGWRVQFFNKVHELFDLAIEIKTDKRVTDLLYK